MENILINIETRISIEAMYGESSDAIYKQIPTSYNHSKYILRVNKTYNLWLKSSIASI